MHSYQFVPAQTDRGVPWALEVANITQGQPKTSRIPTGGWRAYGAVPSHSYPYESNVPGYWQGAGMVGSTVEAQGAKTFGADAPPPATNPYAWLTDITKSVASVYQTYDTAHRPRPVAPIPPQPQFNVGPAAGGGGTNWLLWGGVAVAGAAAFMLFGRKRR